jgi:hypothetical protein
MDLRKNIREGFSLPHSFPVSCGDLELALLNLSGKNKADFLSCFDTAVFSLGHKVPLSFASLLLPSFERATHTPLPDNVFSKTQFYKLMAWKRVCELISENKRIRKRTDGRFGSTKVPPKNRRTIESSTLIGVRKRLSSIKFRRENKKKTMERLETIFKTTSNSIIVKGTFFFPSPYSLFFSFFFLFQISLSVFFALWGSSAW